MFVPRMEGEDRLIQVESCLSQLPQAYHNNLAYLVNFLCELLLYEKITMMNAGENSDPKTSLKSLRETKYRGFSSR